MAEDGSTKNCVGDFEIVRELGRGGMGIVYEARQVSLNRKVALKVISGGLGISSKAVLRFRREAEAAGKLHHTNIVPIYSTGQDNGAHYYAMELIDGPSLHHVIRSLRRGETDTDKVSGSAATMAVDAVPAASANDSAFESSGGAVETPPWVSEILGSPPVSAEPAPSHSSNAKAGSTSRPSSGSNLSSSYFDSVATMIAGAADGLDYAHENGVIHRDIKPANLLLSRDGRVSINDFGLARMLEKPGMTMSGEFVGSPLYMSPEQITAGRAPLDHRTDIYSLGATLYELLTLKPVFPGRSRDEVIAQILHKEPERPRRQNPKVPVDLETVCLKAMEKDPDRRYQSAGQLAQDLRRFVSRHAISARRIGPVERVVRWARRNKAVTAMACLTFLVGLSAAAYVYIGDREHLRKEAMNNALVAAMSGESAKAVAEINKARGYGADASWANMLLGQVDSFRGRSQDALAKFEEAVKEDPESIMARSMLAAGYLENARWADYSKSIGEIMNRTRNTEKLTPEELLFVGLAIIVTDSEAALHMLDRAIDVQSSFTLARIWRANTRVHLAWDRGQVEYAVEARDELLALPRVHQDLQKNPLLLFSRLSSRLAIASIYRSQGGPESLATARTHLREAVNDVESLAAFPDFFLGNFVRVVYYAIKWDIDRLESDLDDLSQVMRVAARSRTTGWLVDCYWTTFFRRGGERIDEALDQLDEMYVSNPNDTYVAWARIVLLMEKGRSEEAERVCRDLIRVEPKWSWVMLFLSAEDAAEFLEKDAGDTMLSTHRKDPRDSKSERQLAEAYFSNGLRALGQGRRTEAKTSFEKGAASPAYGWSPAAFARAFADRMEKDPTWPDWLPATPVGSEAK